MRHQDLTLNHRLESWVYANNADRIGATGFVTGDIGRIAYQSDTGDYWRLTGTAPTWGSIVPTATLQTAAVTPTGTTNTTGVMAGLGSTAKITPVRSGKISVGLSGTCLNNAAGGGVVAVLRYGTGAAPANGAALTGTIIGGVLNRGGAGWGALQQSGCNLSAVITGATLGVEIWMDVQFTAISTGTATLSNVAFNAFELP